MNRAGEDFDLHITAARRALPAFEFAAAMEAGVIRLWVELREFIRGKIKCSDRAFTFAGVLDDVGAINLAWTFTIAIFERSMLS